MDVCFLGTGGPAGWPEAGCHCASCMRSRAASAERRSTAIMIDGRLRIDLGRPPQPAERATGAGRQATGAGEKAAGAGGEVSYRIEPVPGGWDVTGPDAVRLLVAAGPGQVPDPPAGTPPFDFVLLDLLHCPAQLGALRARGLAGDDAIAAVLCADHRVISEAELARRCLLWGAAAPGDGDTLSIAAPPRTGASGLPHRALILGGARSGKSREAELRLAAEPRVTYVAAGPRPDGSAVAADGSPDVEWAHRVAAHRAARPGWWQTIETTDVAGTLGRLRGAVLIDGMGTWLAAVMTEAGAWEQEERPRQARAEGRAAARIAARVDELIAAWRQTGARVVAVSDQVGSSVVPATASGRLFRDQLGWLNQRLSAESEETVLVVAGRVLALTT